MRKVSKSKIIFVISIIFFIIGSYANFNNIYNGIKKNDINNSNKSTSANIAKDEKQKVLDLIFTMDEAIDYLNNNEASYETKKQLIIDLSKAASVISEKINYYDTDFINEVNKQYYNLNNKNTIDVDALSLKYNNWRNDILG